MRMVNEWMGNMKFTDLMPNNQSYSDVSETDLQQSGLFQIILILKCKPHLVYDFYFFHFHPFRIIIQAFPFSGQEVSRALHGHWCANPSCSPHLYRLGVCEHGYMLLYSMCAHVGPVTHPVIQKMTQSDLSLS